MNPAAILLGITLLFVAGGIAYGATRPKPFMGSGARVWVFGDSIGIGVLGPLQEQATAYGVTVTGNPLQDTTIRYWLYDTGSVQDAKNWGATHVIVMLGTNDAAASSDYRGQVSDYASALCARLIAAGMKVAWIGPGSVPKFSEASMQVQHDIEAIGGGSVLVLDPTEAIRRGPDGIHPGPAGYTALAEWILDKLAR